MRNLRRVGTLESGITAQRAEHTESKRKAGRYEDGVSSKNNAFLFRALRDGAVT